MNVGESRNWIRVSVREPRHVFECDLGELLALRWSQVERDGKPGKPEYRRIVLLADTTKTHRARIIPVGPRLRAELEMRRHDPDGKDFSSDRFVFGNAAGERIQSIKTAWRATCQRAGIVDLHFHDLRREFGSRLLESGAGTHDVQEFLGHAALSTTSRYLRTSQARLEAALLRLEGEINQEVRSSRTQVAQNPTEGVQDAAAARAVMSPSSIN